MQLIIKQTMKHDLGKSLHSICYVYGNTLLVDATKVRREKNNVMRQELLLKRGGVHVKNI